MKDRFAFVIPLSLFFVGLSFTAAPVAQAQDQAGQVTPPPKVLLITTEYLKPGQNGSAHEKTEAAFVQAFRDAKWPTHYLGMNALTGRNRAVFFVPYDSFADWEKDNVATAKNTSLSSSLDSAGAADGALLTDVTNSVFHLRDDMSLNPGADVGRTRYFDVIVFHVHMGHEKDWETVVKMYRDAYQKIPGAHWDMFEKMYGDDSANTFIIITPRKSLAEVDDEMGNDKKVHDIVGDDQMQKMLALDATTFDPPTSILLSVNPKMSYPRDEWAKEDADFWGQQQ
jgi:hypothetical protein